MQVRAGEPTAALRHVTAIRYVTPLREGGSLPGLMEADDLGTYAVKFHGAGQGRSVLVAEIVSGELARALGLPVPELCTVDVDPALGLSEPDQEVQDLLRRSPGLNLGTDFLPGALDFDPLAFDPGPDLAGRVLWFDALVGNVDRSWRNSNMLLWHRSPYLIDHGATLTFAHAWSRESSERGTSLGAAPGFAARPYDASDHVLLGCHPDLDAADRALAPLVTADVLDAVTALVPDGWLAGEPGFDTPQDVRDAYAATIAARCAARASWLPGVAEQVAAGRPPPDDAGAAPAVVAAPGCPMSEWVTFEYALLRVVPRIERGECMNAGVIVHCRARDFLRAEVHLDRARLAALDPHADADAVESALDSVAGISGVPEPPRSDRHATGARSAAGPGSGEDIGRRFRRLTTPRSTIVQPGPVHTGRTTDPSAETGRLLRRLVLPDG